MSRMTSQPHWSSPSPPMTYWAILSSHSSFLICRAPYRSLWTTCLRPSSAQPIVGAPCPLPSNTCSIFWMNRLINIRSMTMMSDTPGRVTGNWGQSQGNSGRRPLFQVVLSLLMNVSKCLMGTWNGPVSPKADYYQKGPESSRNSRHINLPVLQHSLGWIKLT